MFNGNYTQSQLPSELFNNVGQTTYNGVTYNVTNKGNGTRDITPVSGPGVNTTPTDPLVLAGSLQQMQVQANQPAIQTLQGQQNNLAASYGSLLSSVMSAGSSATNYFTGAAAANLGARGILPSSQLGQQTIGSAILPISTQTQGAIGSVGLGSAQDINQLARQIASLQAGNVQGAITGAPALAGLAALPSQIALNTAQGSAYGGNAALALANALAAKYMTYPQTGLFDVTSGKNVLPSFLNNG